MRDGLWTLVTLQTPGFGASVFSGSPARPAEPGAPVDQSGMEAGSSAAELLSAGRAQQARSRRRRERIMGVGKVGKNDGRKEQQHDAARILVSSAGA